MSKTATKFDAGKEPLHLLDRHALLEIARVLDFGAKKYGRNNWRGGIEASRLVDAALRHIFAYADGEDADPESGLPHLAHAGCCVVFLLGLRYSGKLVDDRYKDEKARNAGKVLEDQE